MPRELKPKSLHEFTTGICYLPTVIELKENGKKVCYMITDQRNFDADRAETCRMGKNLFPNNEEMKRLATTHGRPMSSEEFEGGEVWPSLVVDGYAEYRFKRAEEQK